MATETTHHDLWESQAHEDFSNAALALFNLAQDLDEGMMSFDGITPADAAARLEGITRAVAFMQATLAALAPL